MNDLDARIARLGRQRPPVPVEVVPKPPFDQEAFETLFGALWPDLAAAVEAGRWELAGDVDDDGGRP